MDKGILVGCDLSQEWLLPWWMSHYEKHNAFPVAFVDFGLSFEMKTWCKQKGALIPLFVTDDFVAQKEEMDPHLVQAMQKASGKEFWPSRPAWFKKPLACLQSPFQKSLWVDLDCQIQGSLDPLFHFCDHKLAIALDSSLDPSDIPVYNSGVIGFKKGLDVIQKWADYALRLNHLYRGDQDALNALLQKEAIEVALLPSLYNWSRYKENNPDAVIIHWHGPQGKAMISHQITKANLEPFL